ncbi:DivIVA domain-containing protein [Micromonospora endophytica]|uniref:DivIVA domain-containing protein n=1 Tax=Micromonospora endophytica TaxID=515350 RepID=UPI001CB9200B|nr:DivIVA domain-containing protein [Micromonospora endophytica]
MIHQDRQQRLLPGHRRAATFGRRLRGLDPDQVYDFLQQVADELERLGRELDTATTETTRILQPELLPRPPAVEQPVASMSDQRTAQSHPRRRDPHVPGRGERRPARLGVDDPQPAGRLRTR